LDLATAGLIWMVPPSLHWQVCALVRIGVPSQVTPQAGPFQPCGCGAHGVETPDALAVKNLHVPMGGMFTPVLASSTVAVVWSSSEQPLLATWSCAGASPAEQVSLSPA
jgi:hypothetical protein